jgi:hypothetical protein
MKTSSLKLFVSVIFASLFSLIPIVAQTRSGEKLPKLMAVTGCIVRGDNPGEVWLAEKNGTIYALESFKIDLNTYLRHKVFLKGLLLEDRGSPAEEAKKQDKTNPSEIAIFRVVTLKMLSTACTR